MDRQHIETSAVSVGDANLYHLAATLVAGVMWIVARGFTRLPMQALALLEATGTMLICLCFVIMAMGFTQTHIAIRQDPMHGLFGGLMATNFVLMSRAIAVPSTPTRTFIVSCVALIPMVVLGPYSVAGAQVPGVNLTASVDITIWSIASVAMAVVASQVIFGLRAEVDKVRRLGQYTLEGKLGEGGMGIVYRASHAMLRRPTAIKILRPEKAGEDALLRFEREVQLTAGLSHPSTVAIFDYGRTPQGLFYYAMEYLDGLNLDQLVRLDGRQPDLTGSFWTKRNVRNRLGKGVWSCRRRGLARSRLLRCFARSNWRWVRASRPNSPAGKQGSRSRAITAGVKNMAGLILTRPRR
jgi:hypothetical protein